MSKQNPGSKAKASSNDMLDDSMITPEAKVGEFQLKEAVSLKEYSKNAPFAFDSRNYKFLLVGLGINILGFILMIGGAAEDPNTFDASALFSPVRITLAPILIVAGYGVIFYSIMKRNKAATDDK